MPVTQLKVSSELAQVLATMIRNGSIDVRNDNELAAQFSAERCDEIHEEFAALAASIKR